MEGSSLGPHFGGEGEELMARMGSGQNMVIGSIILIQSIVIREKMRIIITVLSMKVFYLSLTLWCRFKPVDKKLPYLNL